LKDGADGGKKKQSKPKKSGKAKKKKAESPEDLADEGNQGDDEKKPAPKRKRKSVDKTDPNKKVSRKRTKKSEAAKPSASTESKPEAEGMNGNANGVAAMAAGEADIYLDIALWTAEREALDSSFKAARAHFLKRGPWQLPAAVGESKFRSVAKQTLQKMGR